MTNKFKFTVNSLSGENISIEYEHENITVNKLKEEISKLSLYINSTLIVLNNGEQLTNNDTLNYTSKTIYFIVDKKKSFQSKEELKDAIKNYNSENVIDLYGKINDWNVSLITDMSELFKDNYYFNENISNWDVSNVINMSCMFHGAEIFNQPLEWDVGKVNNMEYMFCNALLFNQLLEWDVRNVTNMRYLFHNAQSFNQNLNWNVKNVTNMTCMFQYSENFNQNLNWNIINVINKKHIFKKSLLEINNNLPDWYK